MNPKTLLSRVLIGHSALALSLLAAFLLAAPAAQAAPQWFDGSVAKSTVINCPSIISGNPYAEEGAWSWVGFYADAGNLPDAGEVFYVHAVTGLVGNPCPGGMYSYPEISLPSGVQPAITASNPVFCWKIGQRATPPTQTRLVGECPQQSSSGSVGGSYGFGAVGLEGGMWPHGLGTVYELQIPVTSSRQLRGTLASPCDCVRGFVKTVDGNSNPVLGSAAGLVVDSAPAGGGTSTPAATPPAGGTPPPGGTPAAGGTSGASGNPSGSGTPAAAGTPGGKPATGGGTATPGAVQTRTAAFRRLVAPSSYSVRRLRRSGLRVQVDLGLARSRVTAMLLGRGGAVLARAGAGAAGPGRKALKLRTAKNGIRLLRRASGFRARLRVTVTPPAGASETKSMSVLLKR